MAQVDPTPTGPLAAASPALLHQPLVWCVLGLIALRWVAQWWLGRLNVRHVQACAGEVPATLRDVMDEATYQKSVAYTLARARLAAFADAYSALVLVVILFSGVLPVSFGWFQQLAGSSVWAMAAFLFAAGVAVSLPALPLDWFEQFKLEQGFGFNAMSQRIWWLDRLKVLLIAGVLGYPLLVLLLKFVEGAGAWWWLWAWLAVMAFQFLMMVLAPIIILPLFHKFTPLPEGELRARLARLAERTQFHARSIQVMDGSKRSRHSNAFFTGFGRFRKIVLFDTLIAQLNESELEAVLAHEIGHYRRKHIPKLLAWAAFVSLVAFYALGVLVRQEWFYRAFGFAADHVAPAFLLFALLGGTISFWLGPLQNWWARSFEYEADAFAAQAIGAAQPLVGALRKLHEKNLSNLTPHPAYSGFYYSHPTLLERQQALANVQTHTPT